MARLNHIKNAKERNFQGLICEWKACFHKMVSSGGKVVGWAALVL